MAWGVPGTTGSSRVAGLVAVINDAARVDLGEPAALAGLSCFASSRCQMLSVSTLSGFHPFRNMNRTPFSGRHEAR
jgi:hypothetical protein